MRVGSTPAPRDEPLAQLRYAAGPLLEGLGRFGLGLDGVMHVLIGGLALRLAWTSPNDPVDQSGALATISHQPWGEQVLWFFVAGFSGLALMQFVIAAKRHRHARGRDRIDRSLAIPIGFWYGGLAVLAGFCARGSEPGGTGSRTDFSEQVFSWPAGRYLVGAIGLGAVGVGLYHGYKGAWKRHRGDMHRLDRAGASGDVLIRIGQFGYVAKGVALVLTGVLVLIAAVQYDPADATGLDHGLRSLSDHAYGPVVLTIIGGGIAGFGIYLIAIMRRGKL